MYFLKQTDSLIKATSSKSFLSTDSIKHYKLTFSINKFYIKSSFCLDL